MARTINAEARAVRRDAFIDTAQRLIQTKGYEQTSVQDVLDELDASKGAFYHYFDSKSALLDSVVQRMIDVVIESLGPIADDPGLPATEKLQRFFGGIANWKTERRELILAIISNWLSDDNAIVRERFRNSVATRLTPLLARIIGQGVRDGSFHVTAPADAASVFVSLLLGANEAATELFIESQRDGIPFETVQRRLEAYAEAFERVLGASPGSLPLVDAETLHVWFS